MRVSIIFHLVQLSYPPSATKLSSSARSLHHPTNHCVPLSVLHSNMASDAPSAELLAVLAACMSSDMNERQAAEAFLTQHELQQGFQNELLRVVAERSLPETVRQQAAIFFKNSVERHWHKRGPKYVSLISLHACTVLITELLTARSLCRTSSSFERSC